MFKDSPLNWQTTGIYIYLALGSVYSLFVEWNVFFILLGLFHYIWFGLASSMYYHRTITHGALKLKLPVEMFFLLGGLIGLGGDPVRWATLHRVHHRRSDQPRDPHSPKVSFWYAYFGWVSRWDDKLIAPYRENICKDLDKNILYSIWRIPLLEGIPHFLYAGILWHFIGWNHLVYVLLFPILLTFNFHWGLIASLCHLPSLGKQRYDVGDNSRNIKGLSLLTFGESMHNNHHKFPNAMNFGDNRGEWDFSCYVAKALQKAGLASDIKIVSYE